MPNGKQITERRQGAPALGKTVKEDLLRLKEGGASHEDNQHNYIAVLGKAVLAGTKS